MSFLNIQSAKKPQANVQSSNEPTGGDILVAVASQLSKLVQVHKLSAEAQAEISLDDWARVDAVKQTTIAKMIVLLTAYYKAQGWNPQEIKTSVLNMLEQQQN